MREPERDNVARPTISQPAQQQFELPPLTEDQKQAIRDCRFVTTNVPRDHAWLIFDDESIIRRLSGVAKRTDTYTRDHVTKKQEHEALVWVTRKRSH